MRFSHSALLLVLLSFALVLLGIFSFFFLFSFPFSFSPDGNPEQARSVTKPAVLYVKKKQ
jgi:hypothetical protein